jgi:two-component system, sensor histidine kinase PdtaS
VTLRSPRHFTCCGLPGIDVVPYGMHACHFYDGREQLVAALVPYFIAGLQANERCLWITAAPLPAREAVQALRAAWPGADEAMQAGALSILESGQWYGSAAQPQATDVVELWLAEEERALAAGYGGLRITGNTSFLTPGDWAAFMDYERAINARFKDRRIVALCSYALDRCDPRQIDEVMQAHGCAFEAIDADWQVVSVPARAPPSAR